jgi:hypothetical protein
MTMDQLFNDLVTMRRSGVWTGPRSSSGEVQDPEGNFVAMLCECVT